LWLEVSRRSRRGYGYNGNTWNFYLNALARRGHPFAILHNDRGTFGYADGHADKRRWEDQSARDMAEANLKEYPTSGQTIDIAGFRPRYIPYRSPKELRL
jgi:prepilin-type processing-associated H-X9-DG protein